MLDAGASGERATVGKSEFEKAVGKSLDVTLSHDAKSAAAATSKPGWVWDNRIWSETKSSRRSGMDLDNITLKFDNDVRLRHLRAQAKRQEQLSMSSTFSIASGRFREHE